MEKVQKEKSKRGPKVLDAEHRRTKCVSVRFNKSEYELLEKRRGKTQRGEYLRLAFLGQSPQDIPELNRDAYAALARAAANLNQLAKKANAEQAFEISELTNALSAFRISLLGVKP